VGGWWWGGVCWRRWWVGVGDGQRFAPIQEYTTHHQPADQTPLNNPQGPVEVDDDQLAAIAAGNMRDQRGGGARMLRPHALQAALDEHPELLSMLLRGMNARVMGDAGEGQQQQQRGGSDGGGGGAGVGDGDDDEDEGGHPHEVACRVA